MAATRIIISAGYSFKAKLPLGELVDVEFWPTVAPVWPAGWPATTGCCWAAVCAIFPVVICCDCVCAGDADADAAVTAAGVTWNFLE